jgi:hypothetical protein
MMDVGGERISDLATDLDGRFPGDGEAGTAELDAAALAGDGRARAGWLAARFGLPNVFRRLPGRR